ncbi:MAG: hypothetical protein WDZ74_01870 [Candidatus Paceibacterota bacterium]
MTDAFLQNDTLFPRVSTRENLLEEVKKALEWDRGHVLGISLKNDSLKAIEKKAESSNAEDKINGVFADLGFDIHISALAPHSWYPAGYGPAIYLVSAYLFGWDKDDIIDLGRISTRGTMLMKVVMRLVSMEKTMELAPKIWRKYYDFGELRPIEYSEEDSFAVFQVVGYDVHPISEPYHCGYFSGVVELVTGSKNTQTEAVKSVYRGETYSEYKISW